MMVPPNVAAAVTSTFLLRVFTTPVQVPFVRVTLVDANALTVLCTVLSALTTSSAPAFKLITPVYVPVPLSVSSRPACVRTPENACPPRAKSNAPVVLNVPTNVSDAQEREAVNVTVVVAANTGPPTHQQRQSSDEVPSDHSPKPAVRIPTKRNGAC